jgi:hypothetical protein
VTASSTAVGHGRGGGGEPGGRWRVVGEARRRQWRPRSGGKKRLPYGGDRGGPLPCALMGWLGPGGWLVGLSTRSGWARRLVSWSCRGRFFYPFLSLSLSLSPKLYHLCSRSPHSSPILRRPILLIWIHSPKHPALCFTSPIFSWRRQPDSNFFFQLNSEASSVHRSCSPEERKKRERCTVSLYIDVINTSVSPPKVTCDLLQKGNPLGVCTLVDGTVPVISSDPCRSGT